MIQSRDIPVAGAPRVAPFGQRQFGKRGRTSDMAGMHSERVAASRFRRSQQAVFLRRGLGRIYRARASVSLAWVFAQLFPVYSTQVFRTHRSSAGPAVLNAIGSRSELCRVKSRKGAEQARLAASAPVHRHSCHAAALTTARSIPPRNPPESRSRAGKKASRAPFGIAGSVHGLSSVNDPVLPKVCPHPFVDQLGLLIFGLAAE